MFRQSAATVRSHASLTCYNGVMELESMRTRLLDFPGATEETPFGPEALVYKVRGKMFALIAWQETPLRITLKCEPAHALFVRDHYAAVLPGYHMNKRHWNTIVLDGSVDAEHVHEMMRDSYDLVRRGLPKSARDELADNADS